MWKRGRQKGCYQVSGREQQKQTERKEACIQPPCHCIPGLPIGHGRPANIPGGGKKDKQSARKRNRRLCNTKKKKKGTNRKRKHEPHHSENQASKALQFPFPRSLNPSNAHVPFSFSLFHARRLGLLQTSPTLPHILHTILRGGLWGGWSSHPESNTTPNPIPILLS